MEKLSLGRRVINWYQKENPRWVWVCCILAAVLLAAWLAAALIFAPPKVTDATLYLGGTFEKTEIIGQTEDAGRLSALRRMLSAGRELSEQPSFDEPDVLLLLDTSDGPLELWVWYDDEGRSGRQNTMVFMYAHTPGVFYQLTGSAKARAESAIEQSVW